MLAEKRAWQKRERALAGSFRRRIEQSDVLARFLGRLLASYLRLCRATGRWRIDGLDQMRADLAQGPVVYLFWHGRLMMAPIGWPAADHAIAAPRDPSPAGRLSAATQSYLGTNAVEVRARDGGVAVLRQVLGLIRGGSSLGLSGDGPKGPDRRVKNAVIDWARATGRPVWLFAWSSRRAPRLRTWDRLMLPLPFAGGAMVYRRWEGTIPKRPKREDYRRIRAELGAALDGAAAAADALAGRTT